MRKKLAEILGGDISEMQVNVLGGRLLPKHERLAGIAGCTFTLAGQLKGGSEENMPDPLNTSICRRGDSSERKRRQFPRLPFRGVFLKRLDKYRNGSRQSSSSSSPPSSRLAQSSSPPCFNCGEEQDTEFSIYRSGNPAERKRGRFPRSPLLGVFKRLEEYRNGSYQNAPSSYPPSSHMSQSSSPLCSNCGEEEEVGYDPPMSPLFF